MIANIGSLAANSHFVRIAALAPKPVYGNSWHEADIT
jgi:hypothetical protein